jgi:hypothetical protein
VASRRPVEAVRRNFISGVRLSGDDTTIADELEITLTDAPERLGATVGGACAACSP